LPQHCSITYIRAVEDERKLVGIKEYNARQKSADKQMFSFLQTGNMPRYEKI
jgi:hypothetical protein